MPRTQETATTTRMVLDSGCRLTPMMRQYLSIKRGQEEGTVVLFRMGDFYECFFEDAADVARILGIALTRRGKVGGFPVPMAGIPHHAAGGYIDRLTAEGRKVAIAEQVEDPRDAVGIVRRAVVQVASPAIPYDLDKADPLGRRFIASAWGRGGRHVLVAIDFTTGEFFGMAAGDGEDLMERIRLLSPREMLLHMGQFEGIPGFRALLKAYDVLPTYLSQEYFDPLFTAGHVERLVPGHGRDEALALDPDVLRPLGAVAYYVCSTQPQEGGYAHVRPFRMVGDDGKMRISLPTLTGLGVLPGPGEARAESLLGFLDRARTPLGSRRLHALLLSPLDDREGILARQELTAFLAGRPGLLEDVRGRLGAVGDPERILAKVGKGRATAADLRRLAAGAEAALGIWRDVADLPGGVFERLSAEEARAVGGFAAEVLAQVGEGPDATAEKGGLIKEGVSPKRDRLAGLLKGASGEVARLEGRYRKETGVARLKVGSNNVAGFFVEVGRGHAAEMPERFRQRHTLVNAVRYVTDELLALEHDVLTARGDLERTERELFGRLVAKASRLAGPLGKTASNVALLDAFASLAWTALDEGFARPVLLEGSGMRLRGAWHPLVKASLQDAFVPHDLALGEGRSLGLITGPNMAGKTTVMREAAIVQVLAQVGSFVPAAEARVGLCDRVFSRLGAGDDILKGRSTFMVEMGEVAGIVRHATARSLVVLDEVGRGTSTYDGLGIAWALVEHLMDEVGALVLFATHYHELVDVVAAREGGVNLTMETRSRKGEVRFLYRLVEGAAGQSFGIHVARMAGLPPSILARAGEVLGALERRVVDPGRVPAPGAAPAAGGPAAGSGSAAAGPAAPSPLERELAGLDPESLTPLEALQKLYEFKKGVLPGDADGAGPGQ